MALQSYHTFPMSAHAIGSATLSFGLVSVPVKMFATGESSAAIAFNWLHKKDGARLKQQYVCSKDGEKVEKDDMVKGFEFSKGQYVTFTPDELKQLEEKATGAIEVTEFVPAPQVDRVYLEKSYFLGPDKGGERAYRLLSEALKQTGRVAVGQYAARGKQYLIAVRPLDGGLVMEQLRYANEIRTIAEVPIPKTDLKKPELQLAMQLVEQASSDSFRPEAYEDNARKRILDQIQRKVEGEEITEEPTEAPKTQIIDLMEALRASLKGKGAPGERKPAKRVEAKAAAKAAPVAKRKVGGARG
jgi:DNA end-binding protein Ku